MAIRPHSELRKVSGITPSQLALIEAFMQGAVYSWVKNNWVNNSPAEFAVRDLVGGTNRDWGGTPLQVLYDKHIAAGKSDEDAEAAAAVDLGWIVKTMLANDRRTFDVGTSGLVNSYRWDPLPSDS